MTLRDPYPRRVCFHFGAGSGATSVLFVFPRRNVAFAMMANLGHARFPFDRLMRIMSPFAGEPWWPRIAGYSVCLLWAAALGRRLVRRVRAR